MMKSWLFLLFSVSCVSLSAQEMKQEGAPQDLHELQPPKPNDQYYWIKGHWQQKEKDKWEWISGYWHKKSPNTK